MKARWALVLDLDSGGSISVAMDVPDVAAMTDADTELVRDLLRLVDRYRRDLRMHAEYPSTEE